MTKDQPNRQPASTVGASFDTLEQIIANGCDCRVCQAGNDVCDRVKHTAKQIRRIKLPEARTEASASVDEAATDATDSWKKWLYSPDGVMCLHRPLDNAAPNNDLHNRLSMAYHAGKQAGEREQREKDLKIVKETQVDDGSNCRDSMLGIKLRIARRISGEERGDG